MDLVIGARGRWLCLSELCGLSMEFAQTLQAIEWQVGQHGGFHYPPVGSLHPPGAAVQDLVDAIDAVDIDLLARESDPLALLVGVGAATDAAMPWQPPHARDALAALPPIVEALRTVGRAIAAAPAAAWWSTPVDLDRQYEVAGEPHTHLSAPQPARAALRAIRDGQAHYETLFAVRPDDPADESSGEWWSKPGTWTGPEATVRPASSRRLLTIGAVELAAQEDSFGPEQAELRQLLPTTDPVRVLEIQQPSDWQQLVTTYPLDVSRSRRGVWWQSTGIDSPWYIPDWQAVADRYDAVHGYLTTAGEALPVPGGHTDLAGWNPDITYWLSDVTTGPIEHWHRTSDDTTTQWASIRPETSRLSCWRDDGQGELGGVLADSRRCAAGNQSVEWESISSIIRITTGQAAVLSDGPPPVSSGALRKQVLQHRAQWRAQLLPRRGGERLEVR